MAIVLWLQPCERPVGISTGVTCLPVVTLIWMHTSAAAFHVVVDLVLAYLRWRIVKRVYIPKREKWGAATSMSLVGLAAVICVVRCVT